MPDADPPEGDKHFDLRELVLVLYESGACFWLVVLGFIALLFLGVAIGSLLFGLFLALLNLGLWVGFVVWAYRGHNQRK